MQNNTINWKKNAIILAATEFCVRCMMMLIRPYIPLYLPELGVVDATEIVYWTGVLSSINFVAQAITTPFWGKLADKVGRKPMVLRCVIFMGVFSIFLSMTTTVYQFCIIRFIMGAISGVNAAATTLVATNTPDKYLGYAIGLIQTGYMAGTLAGPVLGSIIADIVGYKGCLIVAGIVILSLLPFVIFGVKEEFVKPVRTEKRLRKEKISLKQRINSFKEFKQYDVLIVLMLSIGLTQFAMQGNDSYVSLFIKNFYQGDRLNFTVSIAFGALAAANIISATTMGKIGDKLGNIKVMCTCLALFSVTLSMQYITSNVVALTILRIIEGILIAGILPNAYTAITRLTETNIRGTILGITASIVSIGSFAGPTASGVIGAKYGIPSIFLTLGVSLGVFTIFTVYMIKRRYKQ